MTKFRISFDNTAFLTTSTTGALANRLNWRGEVLLTRNEHLLRDKRVLDVASHDGRFSFACLKLGAAHVIGVEGRQNLVENAQTTFVDLRVPSQRYDFVNADIFDFLPSIAPGAVDVILCLGFFYHTIRQVEMVREMQRIAPEVVIIDSNVHVAADGAAPAALVLRREDSAEEHATVDPINLAAWPTAEFVEMLFSTHGYDMTRLDWMGAGVDPKDGLSDYFEGWRKSFVARRHTAWKELRPEYAI